MNTQQRDRLRRLEQLDPRGTTRVGSIVGTMDGEPYRVRNVLTGETWIRTKNESTTAFCKRAMTSIKGQE